MLFKIVQIKKEQVDQSKWKLTYNPYQSISTFRILTYYTPCLCKWQALFFKRMNPVWGGEGNGADEDRRCSREVFEMWAWQHTFANGGCSVLLILRHYDGLTGQARQRRGLRFYISKTVVLSKCDFRHTRRDDLYKWIQLFDSYIVGP